MKYFELKTDEEKEIKDFLHKKFSVPAGFWDDKKLLKRVNSVWVLSKDASTMLDLVRCESAGLLLFLEFKTLKISRQGEAFLENRR